MKRNKKLEFDFLANQFQLIENRIYYSEKHKIAFLLTPKCACSFMKAFFLLNFTDYNQHDLAYNDHQELVDKFSREWLKEHPAPLEIFNDHSIKKYQIVRNPISRLVSLYWGARREDGAVFYEDNQQCHHNVTFMTFLSWIDGALLLEDSNAMRQHFNHAIPQYDWFFSRYFHPLKLEDNLTDSLYDIFGPGIQMPNMSHFKYHQMKSKVKYDQTFEDTPFKNFLDLAERDGGLPPWNYFATEKIYDYVTYLYINDFYNFNYSNQLSKTSTSAILKDTDLSPEDDHENKKRRIAQHVRNSLFIEEMAKQKGEELDKEDKEQRDKVIKFYTENYGEFTEEMKQNYLNSEDFKNKAKSLTIGKKKK